MICACPACGKNNSITAVELKHNGGQSVCVACTRLFDAIGCRLAPADERRYKQECAENNKSSVPVNQERLNDGQILTNHFSREEEIYSRSGSVAPVTNDVLPKLNANVGGQASTSLDQVDRRVPTLDCSSMVSRMDNNLC